MRKFLKFIEQPDGFMFIKVGTRDSTYKFWVLPNKQGTGFKLYYEISAKTKSKGELDLKEQPGG